MARTPAKRLIIVWLEAGESGESRVSRISDNTDSAYGKPKKIYVVVALCRRKR